jgi:hypothetical protein
MSHNQFCAPWMLDCGHIVTGGQVCVRTIAPDDATPAQIKAVNQLAVAAPALAAALIPLVHILDGMRPTAERDIALQNAKAALLAAGIDLTTDTMNILRQGMSAR